MTSRLRTYRGWFRGKWRQLPKGHDVCLSFQLLCRDVEDNARSFKPVVMRMKIPRGCMCRPCSAGVGVKPLEIADIEDKREIWGTYAMLISWKNNNFSGGFRGAQGARPPPPPRAPKFFQISCSFRENLAKSYVGAPPPGELAPPLGKSWIRRWICICEHFLYPSEEMKRHFFQLSEQ